MTIRVQGPDGAIIEFPAGTPDDVMSKALAAHYAPKLPAPDMPAYSDPLGMGGAEIMAAPSSGENITPRQLGEKINAGAGAGLRLATNAASFGMANRAAALTSGKSYDEGLKEQLALDADAKARLGPTGSIIAEGAGMLGTGVGLARAGVTVAGRVGERLLPRMLGYGAEGAAFGAAQEAGKNYGSMESKLQEAKDGMMIGGGVGALLPLGGAAIGKGYEMARNAFARPIEGATRGANALAKTAAREGDLAALQQLGPEAMLADVSPTMLGLTQGAAAKPGTAKDLLVETLAARDAGTAGRLNQARESALGQRVVPSQVEAELAAGRKALGPEYETALNGARAVDTAPLAQRLEALAINERGAGQAAANDVRGMLNIPGNPQALDPHPRALLATRRAVDGMREATMDPNAKRILSGARGAVDEELAAAVPGIKQVDGRFAELSGQSRGLERGQETFDTARTAFVRPEQLAEEMARAAAPKGVVPGPSAEPLRMRQGMNAEVDRLVSTGTDDLRKLENTFKQSANQDKLKIGFGDDNAQMLIDAITANRRMRDTYNAVDRGSQTAQRQAANEAITGAEMRLPESGGASGLAIRGANKVLQFVSGKASDATRRDLAELLSKQGPEAVAALESIVASARNAKEAGQAIKAFAINPGGINARVGTALALRPDDQQPRRRSGTGR